MISHWQIVIRLDLILIRPQIFLLSPYDVGCAVRTLHIWNHA